jgi:acyl carrier protein
MELVSELASRLLKFVQEEVSAGGIPLTGDTDLLLSGAVDSLGVIRITQWLEDETGIEVDPADVTLENFQTVDRMVRYARSLGATE